MKELIKILLLLAVNLFVTTSCSSDEDLALLDDEETLPVWITEDGHFDVDLYNASVKDSVWRSSDLDYRRESLNIPEDILPTLTTRELVYACSAYPFTTTYFGFEDPVLGLIYFILEYYNGYHELLERDDYREAIAEYVMNSEYLKNFKLRYSSEDTEKYYRDAGILLLLDHNMFVDGMDKSIAKRLLTKCLEYQSSGYLNVRPFYYVGQYKEDGTPRIYFYVIDSVVNRLSEYLQEQE